MALSNAERQEALRARRALLGMTEVRGVYLPPPLHSSLKAHAQKLLKTRVAETVAEGFPKRKKKSR
jgi:hypothetical protein